MKLFGLFNIYTMKEDELARYISEGFETAKAGNAIEPYMMAKPYAANGILPARSHYAFGWIAYYALHQAADHDILLRKQILATYLRLNVPRPHKLHSMVLTEAIRLYRNAREAAFGKKKSEAEAFSIVRFCGLWGLENLREGDWRRKAFEGKTLGSTAEKLITVYVDELEDTSAVASAGFRAVLDKALATFPDSAMLLMQRAAIHASEGAPDEARLLLKRALLTAPGKFFLWQRLAMLISKDADIRLHVALLYKALKSPGQEQFKGRIRLALADALISRGMQGEALWELERVRRVYEANGWNLPAAYRNASKKIADGTSPVDPEPIYRRLESLADDEVYASLPEVRARKTYHKSPEERGDGKGFGRQAVAWRVTDGGGSHYWVQPHRFGIGADLPLGTEVLIRVHQGKAVRLRLAPDPA